MLLILFVPFVWSRNFIWNRTTRPQWYWASDNGAGENSKAHMMYICSVCIVCSHENKKCTLLCKYFLLLLLLLQHHHHRFLLLLLLLFISSVCFHSFSCSRFSSSIFLVCIFKWYSCLTCRLHTYVRACECVCVDDFLRTFDEKCLTIDELPLFSALRFILSYEPFTLLVCNAN